MSAGAVFVIISNDGKADKMIMATDLLEQRIDEIRRENRMEAVRAGLDPLKEDLDPTLAEIGETHVIHFQSKFKPFVTIGMEYQKLVPQSGGSSFGTQVTFSLAQFGDFFTDMALNINVSQCSANVGKFKKQTINTDAYQGFVLNGTTGPTSFTAPEFTLNNGQTIQTWQLSPQDPANVVVKEVISLGIYTQEGYLVQGDTAQNNVYYCDFPGERALRSVSFEINGNPLDDYDCFSYVFYRNFKLLPNKAVGYYRGVCQEMPVDAYGKNFADGARMFGQICDGPQTPRKTQPPIQIWQKLLFWFNLDFSLALPSAAIPFGQRYINIYLEEVAKLVYAAASVFNMIQVINFVIPAVSPSTAPAGQQYNISQKPSANAPNTQMGNIVITTTQGIAIQTFQEYIMDPVLSDGIINYPNVQSMSLFVNNIFTHPAVHDLYIKRIGFYLVRIHRRQKQAMNQADLNLLLNNFKFPIEYMFVGILPDDNVLGEHSATDWHQFCKVDHKETPYRTLISDTSIPCSPLSTLSYTQKIPAIAFLDVYAHGVQLVQKTQGVFFNSYIPENFGQHTITTPRDPGAMMVNFALYPNVFQPSGHINVSRAREFYIHVWSDVIGNGSNAKFQNGNLQNTAGQLIVEGSALNFLLISDGSAVLRYST